MIESLKQPIHYIFIGFVLFIFILNFYIAFIQNFLCIIITVGWILTSFYAWTNPDGYLTIWFAGFITWICWLLEASKYSDVSFSDKHTCPWIQGSDALFWAISVPLWAFFIGIWARSWTEEPTQWAAWVAVSTLGYATWLTFWRISSTLPFLQNESN